PLVHYPPRGKPMSFFAYNSLLIRSAIDGPPSSLNGDWTAIEGAFFDCWSESKHVIAPVALPDDWLRFRSGDWGSKSPFSFGWWAVAGDDFTIADGRTIPRGALVRYREWYGKGDKLFAEEVGRGIAEL